MITIFLCGTERNRFYLPNEVEIIVVVEVLKGVPSRTGDFLRLLVGELGTHKLAEIFAYGKSLYPYIMLLDGASDLDQRCLKTHNSEDFLTFPLLRTWVNINIG